jgi:hypothetical protein
VSDDYKTANAGDAALPRFRVGPDVSSFTNLNAQTNRDTADRRGLTAEIEAHFAAGKTVAQVQTDMADRLAPLEEESQTNFLLSVRATLGIPSQATAEGKAEFATWKAARDRSLNAVQGETADRQPSATENSIGVDEPDPVAHAPAQDAGQQAAESAAIDGLKVNGTAITSIAFERSPNGGGFKWDVSFRNGDTVVDEAKGLSDAAAYRVVGHENFHAMREHSTDGTKDGQDSAASGVISGEKLKAFEPEQNISAAVSIDRPEFDGKPLTSIAFTRTPSDQGFKWDVSLLDGEKVVDQAQGLSDAATQRLVGQVNFDAMRNFAADRSKDRDLAVTGVLEGETLKPLEPGQAVTRSPDAKQNPKQKAIFAKTGYTLPKSVSAMYVARNGKFVDRKSERIHFEDSGKKLSTTSDDRPVVESMIEVAKAKNWTRLELRGSEEFKRQAWIAAEVAGLESTGYKPTEQDKATVRARREEMRIAGGERGEDTRSTENSISVDGPSREQEKDPATVSERAPGTASEVDPDKGLSDKQRTAISTLRAVYEGRGDPKDAVLKALEVARSRFVDDRVHAGRVLDHGEAPYNHDPDNSTNYYVVLDTPQGERTVWGIDLARNADEGLLNVGEDVLLAYRGKEPVTVPTAERDPEGNLTGRTVEITTHRNTWVVMEAAKLLRVAETHATAQKQAEGQSVAAASPADTATNKKSSDADLQKHKTEWTPERLAELRADLQVDREVRVMQDAQDLVERYKDPAYRKSQAADLLRRFGRDPNEFGELRSNDAAVVGANVHAQARVDAPPKEVQPAREPASAKEVALKAVLEHEMEIKDLPEEDRRMHRANLEASLASARDAGQDLGIPDPLTIDRSAAVATAPAVQMEQSLGNPSMDINH